MPGILRFLSMLFLIFEKCIKEKIAPDILRFGNMCFLILEQGMRKKLGNKF